MKKLLSLIAGFVFLAVITFGFVSAYYYNYDNEYSYERSYYNYERYHVTERDPYYVYDDYYGYLPHGIFMDRDYPRVNNRNYDDDYSYERNYYTYTPYLKQYSVHKCYDYPPADSLFYVKCPY